MGKRDWSTGDEMKSHTAVELTYNPRDAAMDGGNPRRYNSDQEQQKGQMETGSTVGSGRGQALMFAVC